MGDSDVDVAHAREAALAEFKRGQVDGYRRRAEAAEAERDQMQPVVEAAQEAVAAQRAWVEAVKVDGRAENEERHLSAAAFATLAVRVDDFNSVLDGGEATGDRRVVSTDGETPLGERVAHLRRRLGLSQVELAAQLGRSESWLSQVERGVRSVDRLSVLTKLAQALDVPVADLAELDAGEATDG